MKRTPRNLFWTNLFCYVDFSERTFVYNHVYLKNSGKSEIGNKKFDKKKKNDMQRRATPVVMGGESLDEEANEASWANEEWTYSDTLLFNKNTCIHAI